MVRRSVKALLIRRLVQFQLHPLVSINPIKINALFSFFMPLLESGVLGNKLVFLKGRIDGKDW